MTFNTKILNGSPLRVDIQLYFLLLFLQLSCDNLPRIYLGVLFVVRGSCFCFQNFNQLFKYISPH